MWDRRPACLQTAFLTSCCDQNLWMPQEFVSPEWTIWWWYDEVYSDDECADVRRIVCVSRRLEVIVSWSHTSFRLYRRACYLRIFLFYFACSFKKSVKLIHLVWFIHFTHFTIYQNSNLLAQFDTVHDLMLCIQAVRDISLKTRCCALYFCRKKLRYIFNHLYTVRPGSYIICWNNAK